MTDHCSTCKKTVYAMEAISADGVVFHKACFRCHHCQAVLSLGKYAAMEGVYYCKPHFSQLFRLKGSYKFGDSETAAAASAGGGGGGGGEDASPAQPRPLRRKSSVAEAMGKVTELTPQQCQTAQEVFNTFDADGDQRLSRTEVKNVLLTCKPSLRPFQAEQQSRVKVSEYQASADGFLNFEEFKGFYSELLTDEGFDPELRSQAGKGGSSGGAVSSHSTSGGGGGGSGGDSKFGGQTEKCTECNKTVYTMDKVSAEGVVFHKACFRCLHCSKTLTLGSYAAMGGKYYCKPHFKQLFQLKGNYSEGFGEQNPKHKWQGSPASPGDSSTDSPVTQQKVVQQQQQHQQQQHQQQQQQQQQQHFVPEDQQHHSLAVGGGGGEEEQHQQYNNGHHEEVVDVPIDNE